MSKYEVGRQPCDSYKPTKDFMGFANEHCCAFCVDRAGLVSFCENCMRDHHAGGIEACEHRGCGCKEDKSNAG